MMTTPPNAQSSDDPIRVLETRLAGTLRPVSPPNEFVHRLKGNIHLPVPRLSDGQRRGWRAFLVALVSVLGGFMLIVALARVIFHLLPGWRKE